MTLEIVRPARLEELEAVLLHRAEPALRRPPGFAVGDAPSLDCGGTATDEAPDRPSTVEAIARQFEGAKAVGFDTGRSTRVPLQLSGVGQAVVGLRLRAPPSLKTGTVFTVDLVLRDDERKHVIGGLAVEAHVAKGA